jgi:hypothetical protein
MSVAVIQSASMTMQHHPLQAKKGRSRRSSLYVAQFRAEALWSPDRYFDPCSHAGRKYERFVQRLPPESGPRSPLSVLAHTMILGDFPPLLFLHSALMTPIPHSMARSCMLLCADIHHCVGCRELLCIKMLGADPVATQAAAFIAACCSTDDGCSMHAGREMPTSGVRTEIAVVRRGR